MQVTEVLQRQEEEEAVGTSQAAAENIWDQLGDHPREGTSIIVGKRQRKAAGPSSRTRGWLAL